MHVGVGSENPVKVAATADAFERFPEATVDGLAVESGVPDQPFGREQTRRGAENRARRALAAESFDFGVGIEGGVAELDGGLALVMWAAVTDGTAVGRGAGPSLELPADVAERVRAGEELGDVMDDVVGEDDVARNRGAAGVLSGGAVDRRRALADAVAFALGPFVTGHY